MIATDHKIGATYFTSGVTSEAKTLTEESLYYKGDPYKGNALIREEQGETSLKADAGINNDFHYQEQPQLGPYLLNKENEHDWPAQPRVLSMDRLPAIYHPHDVDFLERKINAMPYRFQRPIARQYSQIYQQHGRSTANLSMLRTAKAMPTQKAVTLAGSNADLIAYADQQANRCYRAKSQYGVRAFQPLANEVKAMGIDPPVIKGNVTTVSALNRLCDPLWWRRALRKHYGRDVEKSARDVGLVHKGAGIYSSDETLYRREQQKRRNRLMLEEILAVNELGEEYTLAELSDLSVSNPTIRRGELMTRIAGFEKIANDLNHKALFVTITCPSRFHSHTVKNDKSVENPRYDGSNPRQAQAYLQKVWARIRAKLARHGITLYGFRVAEPNHEGCVHWHLLVFVPTWANRRVQRTIKHYALADSPHELGAQKHRVTFVEIDPSKGTAAGYIAKYIAKNIDGFALDQDLFGGDPLEAAARVDAWAACWGIRQFQQLGGPPVTVWRELRRIEGEESGVLETARDAADRGDWAVFVAAMGGPTCARKARPIQLAKAIDLVTLDESTGEVMNASPVINKYGEPSAAQIIGVSVGDQITATRWHVWELIMCGDRGGWDYVRDLPEMSKETHEKILFTADYGSLIRQGTVPVFEMPPPWSSVNNCTELLSVV